MDGPDHLVVLAGEVRSTSPMPPPEVIRNAVLDIGYDHSDKGFDGETCAVQFAVGKQSSDIAQGVDQGHEARVGSSTDELDLRGAGDQGLMFGYACDDTDVLMPLPIVIAQRLAEKLTEVRKNGTLPTDPWKNEYKYAAPGQHGAYDIVSMGPDGKEGGDGADRDITSWDP